MRVSLKSLAVCLVGASLLTGCATRKQLRVGLEEQRTALQAELQAERSAREAADAGMARDIETLRTDIQGLRTEFGAKITALEEGMRFAFPVHFGFNEATVREEDRAALDRFAQVVQRHYPGSVITVEGFADPAGSSRYNLALSKRRAEAVRTYIVGQGLPDANIRAVGMGEARPVVRGAAGMEPGAEQNRRVVFVVESRGDALAGTPTSTSR
jgi:outer membrane protein OmpA-like peptidoglycan-associated protein